MAVVVLRLSGVLPVQPLEETDPDWAAIYKAQHRSEPPEWPIWIGLAVIVAAIVAAKIRSGRGRSSTS